MEQDLLAELRCAVACYVTAMEATADCLEQACPNAGGPYRQRIRRLRARLAFAPTRKSLEEGKESFEAELKDYAAVASSYLKERSVEMERGLLGLSDIIEHLRSASRSLQLPVEGVHVPNGERRLSVWAGGLGQSGNLTGSRTPQLHRKHGTRNCLRDQRPVPRVGGIGSAPGG